MAEQSVIGTILLSPKKMMPLLQSRLKYTDFQVLEYANIYKTCSDKFLNNKPIDVVTLSAELGNEYKNVLIECANKVPTLSNWENYMQIVLDTAKRSSAFEQVSQLQESLLCGDEVQECQNIATKVCETLSTTQTDVTVSALEGFAEYYQTLNKKPEYIKTGMSRLDYYLHISRGDFIVVGARPSVGKTALTLQLMLNISKTHKVVYFSLETGRKNLYGRMTANLTGISMNILKKQNLNKQQYVTVAKAGDMLDKRNFHIIESSGWTVEQMKAKSIQLGAQVIFIDYVGLINAPGKNRYEKITNTSIALHTMAQQSNITTFALSQLNRDGSEAPTLVNLRESGQLEQDADAVILLHAPKTIDEPERDLMIPKNKEGQCGVVKMHFDGQYQRFTEAEYRH